MKHPLVAIADDDLSFANYLKTFLASRGYESRIYGHGEELLAAARHGDVPDVVLSDIGMHGMDGFEFVGKLRGEPTLKSVLCIALSGFGQEADVKMAENAGFDAHLKKPVMLEDLLHVFSRLRT